MGGMPALEYFFGSASAHEVGKKVLRVRIGPTINSLEVYNVNDDHNPHFIDSPYYTGHFAIRVRNFKGITRDGSEPIPSTEYFGTRRRTFSIQMAGRFKHSYGAGDVVFGAEFPHKVNPPTGIWVAIKFATLIDGALQTDVYADQPWLYSPMLASMNIMNVRPATHAVTKPADEKKTETLPSPLKAKFEYEVSAPSKDVKTTPTPEQLLGKWEWGGPTELVEDNSLLLKKTPHPTAGTAAPISPDKEEEQPKEKAGESSSPDEEDEEDDSDDDLPFEWDAVSDRRKFFGRAKNHDLVVFKPENIYNFEIFAPFMDFNTFDLSLGVNINALRYLNDQPITMIMKSKSKNIPFFVMEFALVDPDAEKSAEEEDGGKKKKDKDGKKHKEKK
ncbi:hypothetical protein BJ742DRAFT_908783 [Cladochytrium replicatum]|nr:hypothetical protein BJ742DRAFT_908783 [Cladochytrium replicatum]